jgi:hemolysin activation/secretion protein
MTLDKLVLKRKETQMAYSKTLTKSEIYDSMSVRNMTSGIFLQLRFHTLVPLNDYDMKYDIRYSQTHKAWTESNITSKSHSSKTHEIEYSYLAERQEVIVDISCTPKEGFP